VPPRVRPTSAEVHADLPGDDLVPLADVVMDRAFDLAAAPAVVWPWLVQLGKQRAGWYFPRWVERVIPRRRRGLRAIDPRWQSVQVGEVIPDYGGAKASFTAALVDPARTLVYRDRRGRMALSWAIVLTPVGTGTRVHLRLRLAPVRRPWLARVGELFDLLTVLGLAAGLRERV
jgi:hypothetical protein